MADPLTAVGAAASVAGILDILTRCITVVIKFAEQLEDADLTFTSLLSQLQILRGALTEVQRWAEITDAQDAYHQLTIDLDSILLCCRSLVSKLDAQLTTLDRNSTGQLRKLAKVKLVLSGRNIDDIQKMIAQQVGALNLLLTACNSNALLEQKQLLEKKSTRLVFSVVETDSASLIVHYDAGSLKTAATDNLSKLSRLFGFDEELRSSKVYERAWRSTIRLTLRLEKTARPDRTTEERFKRLGSFVPREDPDFKILLLGRSYTSKTTLLKQMKLCWAHSADPFPESQRMAWKPVILSNLHDMVWAADDNFGKDSSCTDKFSSQVQSSIDEFMSSYDTLYGDINCDETCRKSFLAPLINCPAAKSGEEKCRLCQVCLGLCPSITEAMFDHDGHLYRVFDVGGVPNERSKWIHCFENVDIILFQVNLGAYDETLLEDSATNQLQESLRLFRSIWSSRWFRNTSIFLTFTMMDVFEQKISRGETLPLEKTFPFEGDPTDVIAVRDAVSTQFLSGTAGRRDIRVSYIDATDTSQVQELLQTVHEVTKERAKTPWRNTLTKGPEHKSGDLTTHDDAME